jgi:riboflavin biosynthesis pyrimidine reductase
MVSSVDGRIVPRRWRLSSTFMTEYERTAKIFDADAWMVGRITMVPYAGKANVPKRASRQPIPRTDFIALRDAGGYAIALDASGKLTWKSSSIDDDHVVTILTGKVSDDYLAFLRSKGVSYLFGGNSDVDLKRVLEKLRTHLGIKTLLVEGGGKINGSFLDADLIDEVSVLIAPIADGGIGTPSLFDATEGFGPSRRLKLVSVEKRRGGLVWLRYLRKR